MYMLIAYTADDCWGVLYVDVSYIALQFFRLPKKKNETHGDSENPK